MDKTDPKVALPEVAAEAFLMLDVAGLENLEQQFGPKYFSLCMEGLDDHRQTIVRAMLAVSLHGAEPADAMKALPPVELSQRLLDATLRLLTGKTLAETRGAKQ